MNSEFSELLADVKEQILYLQELGAENLAVEFAGDCENFKFQIPNSKFDQFAIKDFTGKIGKICADRFSNAENRGETETCQHGKHFDAPESFGSDQIVASAVSAETKFFYFKQNQRTSEGNRNANENYD